MRPTSSRFAAVAALVLGLGLALGGCTTHCTDEARAGITVRVTDKDTGAALDASVEAVDGQFVEKLMSTAPGEYAGVYERAGTYTVTVAKGGYVAMTVQPVEVKTDSCHVITRTLDVQLMAIPTP